MAGGTVLLHTIPANKRGGVEGGNGPAGAPTPTPACPVLAANIEYFCRVVKLGYARVTTNHWPVMYDCLLPDTLHNTAIFRICKALNDDFNTNRHYEKQCFFLYKSAIF